MSSYAPDETAHELLSEAAWLQGAIVTSAMYGVALTLAAMCFRSLWIRIRSRGPTFRKDIFFFCYVFAVISCATIYNVANAQITQLGFINRRNYPGGPSAFEESNSSIPINVTFILMDWFADLLMIWRCIVVYRDTRFRIFITIFGIVIFLGCFVTASLWVITVSLPAQAGNNWMSYSLLFPYLSVSLASTIFISCLTVLRFLYHRHHISRVLGPNHGTIYASFAAMIIESASIYSICSLLYIIPFAIGNPLANAFLQMLGMAQGIAPLLIIYRVAEGKAWSGSNTDQTLTSTSFRMHRTSTNPTTQNNSHARSNPLNIQVTFDVQKSTDDSVVKSTEDKERDCRDCHAV